MTGARGFYEPFFYLWLGQEEVKPELLSLVKSFSYEEDDEKIDELRFTIVDADFFLQEYLKKGMIVRAQWGYLHGMSKMKECQIEEIEYSFPEEGPSEIVVKALDRGIDLVMSRSRRCFHSATGKEVIEIIAKKHNLKPQINIPEDFEVEFIAQGGKNDYEFIKELAAERCCSFWISNQELHVAPNQIGKDQWQVEYGSGDSILLSARVRSLVKERGTRDATKGVGVAALRKNVIEDETLYQERWKKKSTGDNEGHLIVTPAEEEIVEKKIKAEVHSAQMSEQEADFRFMGIPQMEPKCTFLITGLGPLFSGKWYVKTIQHQISSAGYTCSAKAVSKGSAN